MSFIVNAFKRAIGSNTNIDEEQERSGKRVRRELAPQEAKVEEVVQAGPLLPPPPVQPPSAEPVREVVFTRFETDLIAAGDGAALPAAKRLALFICRRQNDTAFKDEHDVMEKSNAFAGALLAMANEKSVKPTPAEIAPLYERFLTLFEKMVAEQQKPIEELSVRWYVDYHPEGDLSDIISEWFKEIKTAREKASGPNLPYGDGLGIKCSYRSDDGAAMLNDKVIDHDGTLLAEDPWETFYRTENLDDERKALSLEPKKPEDIARKFQHRQIVRQMGYTLEQHAVTLARAGDWGIVTFLISEQKEAPPHEIGYAILTEAARHKCLETCKALFKAGLPLYNEQQGSEQPFFRMVREWKSDSLHKITEIVKLPAVRPDTVKEIAYHLALRFKEKEWDEWSDRRLFGKLCDLWTGAHFPNQKLYKIDEKQRNVCSANFCEAILQAIRELQITPKSADLVQTLQKRANKSAQEYRYTLPAAVAFREDRELDYAESRGIVSAMGFTFQEYAASLSSAQNWGLVMCLIENADAPIDQKVGRKVLSSAYYAKQHEICLALFRKGLPIFTERYSSQDTFFNLVRDMDSEHLNSLLDVVQLPDINRYRRKETFEGIAYRLMWRYRERMIDATEQEIFNKLCQLWVAADVFSQREIAEKSFYKALIQTLDNEKSHFKDEAFERSLREKALDEN